MLGILGNLAVFGALGEATGLALKAAGKYAVRHATKVYSTIRAGLRAGKTIANSPRVMRSLRTMRAASRRAYAYERRKVGRQAAYLERKLTRKVVTGSENTLKRVVRMTGARRAKARAVMSGVIKGELKFLPVNYGMYQHEKHQGRIDPNTSFLKWYGTSMLPASVGFGFATKALGRYGKIMKRAVMSSPTAAFGMEALTKFGIGTLGKFNAMTLGARAVGTHMLSKVLKANASQGMFKNTTSTIKEIAHTSTAVNVRRARRTDFNRFVRGVLKEVDTIAATERRQELVMSRAKALGRAAVVKDGEIISTIGESKIARFQRNLYDKINRATGGDGLSKEFTEYHYGLQKSKALTYLSTIEGTKLEMVKDRAIYEIAGDKIDIGMFHANKMRAALNSFATKYFNIANRPWFQYIDAGQNLLEDRRTRLLSRGLYMSKGNAFLNEKESISVQVARPKNIDTIEALEKAGRTEEAAHMVVQEMTNLDPKETKLLLGNYYNRAIERFRGTGSQFAEEDVKESVRRDIISAAKTGVWRLSRGDILDVSSGYATIYSGSGNSALTYTLSYGGKAIEIQGTLKGSSRAGRVVGGLLGGGIEINNFGRTYRIGIHSGRTIKRTAYYQDVGKGSRFMMKLADFLDLGNGPEASIWHNIGSAFTKHKKLNYIGTLATKINQEGPGWLLNRLGERAAMSESAAQTQKTIIRTMNNYAKKQLDATFEAIQAAARNSETSHVNMSDALGDIFTRFASVLGREIDTVGTESQIKNEVIEAMKFGGNRGGNLFKEVAIDTGDSTTTAYRKAMFFQDWFDRNENLLRRHGLEAEIEPVRELIRTFAQRGADDLEIMGMASYHTGKGSVEKYNKAMYGFLTRVIGAIGSSDRDAQLAAAEGIGKYVSVGREYLSRKFSRLTDISKSGITAAIRMRDIHSKFTKPSAGVGEKYLLESVNDMVELATMFRKRDNTLLEAIRPFGDRGGRFIEAEIDENMVVLVGKPGDPSMSAGTAADGFRTAPVSRGTVATINAMETMNSALSVVGLGFSPENIHSMSKVIKSTLTKRVLPFAAFSIVNDAVGFAASNIPVLNQTGLAGGLTGAMWDVYAGARVAAQYVSDATGITDFAGYMEDIAPGSWNSPLSGLARGILPIAMGLKLGGLSRVGPMRGGMIGLGVSFLLAGGPLAAFDAWDLSKGRDQLLAELRGEQEVKVNKARFWELSAGSFWGDKISYYRPHMYALQKAKWKNADNYLDDDLMDNVMSYVDPGVYARKHYYSRPYTIDPGPASNIPIIGKLIGGLTPDNIMHKDVLADYAESALLREQIGMEGFGPDIQENLELEGMGAGTGGGFYGGERLGGGMSPYGRVLAGGGQTFAHVFDKTVDNLGDIAGMRGFLAQTALQTLTGDTTLFSGGYALESSNRIGSISRQYWDLSLGGLMGLSEGIRRIIPKEEKGGLELVNINPNVMPFYLPGAGSFRDFLTGDPYTKLEMGEARLPGSAYEVTHDVKYTFPLESIVMGKPLEEQVAFYAGDTLYLAQMRRTWNVVERTRKQIIGHLKKQMDIKKEADVAYDPRYNVEAMVDAIAEDPNGNKVAIHIAPMEYDAVDPGGFSQLNAYLVNNNKDIHEGLLIYMDKDGNITKQLITADVEKYKKDVAVAMKARQIGAKASRELQESGHPVFRGWQYSHVDRLKILVNVAPFSKEAQMEMKIVQQQMQAGMLDDQDVQKYKRALKEFGERMNSLRTTEYRFLPYLMDKTPIGKEAMRRMQEVEENYTPTERVMGGLWEYISHLRTPITNKLIGNRSIVEAYKQDIAVGKSFRQWQTPIDDFVMPSLAMLGAETDPVQGFVSGITGGFIFGGPLGATILGAGMPMAIGAGLTQNKRAGRWEEVDKIMKYADAIQYAETEAMQNELAGKERSLTLRRNQSLFRTYTETAMSQAVPGSKQVLGGLSRAERSYVRRIMQNMYAEDAEDISALLPEHVRPIFDAYVEGGVVDNSEYMREYQKIRQVMESAPLQFRSEDVVYKTFQYHGLNAHDVSLGWRRQMNRVKYMEAAGYEIPTIPIEQEQ